MHLLVSSIGEARLKPASSSSRRLRLPTQAPRHFRSIDAAEIDESDQSFRVIRGRDRAAGRFRFSVASKALRFPKTHHRFAHAPICSTTTPIPLLTGEPSLRVFLRKCLLSAKPATMREVDVPSDALPAGFTPAGPGGMGPGAGGMSAEQAEARKAQVC